MIDKKEYYKEWTKNHPWYFARKQREHRAKFKKWKSIKQILFEKRIELWHPL